MDLKKQVEKSHYEFSRYMTKARWSSVWHQLDEVIRIKPENVLEIGPGPGVFKHIAKLFGINAETLDLDLELQPDYVGSATALPFPDNSYDLVCAFQMLEHLPYKRSIQAFAEMVRVSRRSVVISLPDSRTMWRYQFYLPKFGGYDFLLPRPSFKRVIQTYDREHHWELNKKGYELRKVIDDLSAYCELTKTYLVRDNPYHRFFVFRQ